MMNLCNDHQQQQHEEEEHRILRDALSTSVRAILDECDATDSLSAPQLKALATANAGVRYEALRRRFAGEPAADVLAYLLEQTSTTTITTTTATTTTQARGLRECTSANVRNNTNNNKNNTSAKTTRKLPVAKMSAVAALPEERELFPSNTAAAGTSSSQRPHGSGRRSSLCSFVSVSSMSSEDVGDGATATTINHYRRSDRRSQESNRREKKCVAPTTPPRRVDAAAAQPPPSAVPDRAAKHVGGGGGSSAAAVRSMSADVADRQSVETTAAACLVYDYTSRHPLPRSVSPSVQPPPDAQPIITYVDDDEAAAAATRRFPAGGNHDDEHEGGERYVEYREEEEVHHSAVTTPPCHQKGSKSARKENRSDCHKAAAAAGAVVPTLDFVSLRQQHGGGANSGGTPRGVIQARMRAEGRECYLTSPNTPRRRNTSAASSPTSARRRTQPAAVEVAEAEGAATGRVTPRTRSYYYNNNNKNNNNNNTEWKRGRKMSQLAPAAAAAWSDTFGTYITHPNKLAKMVAASHTQEQGKPAPGGSEPGTRQRPRGRAAAGAERAYPSPLKSRTLYTPREAATTSTASTAYRRTASAALFSMRNAQSAVSSNHHPAATAYTRTHSQYHQQQQYDGPHTARTFYNNAACHNYDDYAEAFHRRAACRAEAITDAALFARTASRNIIPHATQPPHANTNRRGGVGKGHPFAAAMLRTDTTNNKENTNHNNENNDNNNSCHQRMPHASITTRRRDAGYLGGAANSNSNSNNNHNNNAKMKKKAAATPRADNTRRANPNNVFERLASQKCTPRGGAGMKVL